MTVRPADERMDVVISVLLATGVALAALIVLVGGVGYLAHSGHQAPHYHVFRGEPGNLRTIPAIARGALSLDPPAVIQLGLLVLIATPVARVLFSVVAFALQRDRLYVAVTLVVLAVLLTNLLGRG